MEDVQSYVYLHQDVQSVLVGMVLLLLMINFPVKVLQVMLNQLDVENKNLNV
ncbi:hypothetical protein X975_00654, partial [Stegodyphus mimosarum]